MQLVVEISLYPLDRDYIPPIKDFIDRLHRFSQLKVKTSATSTLVSGEYLSTMQILAEEMQKTHEQIGQAVFVCKFLNGDKMHSGADV
ncbi:MAG: hypothetical protein GW763_13630 [Paraglaciecola sp.]|nr:hypothetical protein [Paraglaciecola sp.]NCT49000.1 hypothetical protein [Paraglaciecola sp.]